MATATHATVKSEVEWTAPAAQIQKELDDMAEVQALLADRGVRRRSLQACGPARRCCAGNDRMARPSSPEGTRSEASPASTACGAAEAGVASGG